MCLNMLSTGPLAHHCGILCCQVSPALCRPWNKAVLPLLLTEEYPVMAGLSFAANYLRKPSKQAPSFYSCPVQLVPYPAASHLSKTEI